MYRPEISDPDPNVLVTIQWHLAKIAEVILGRRDHGGCFAVILADGNTMTEKQEERKMKPTMSIQRVTLLSYLTGLAPVGEEIWLYTQHVIDAMEDMGFYNKDSVRQLFFALIHKDKAVEQTASHTYIVRKRPEDFDIILFGDRYVRANPLWKLYGDEYAELVAIKHENLSRVRKADYQSELLL